MSFFLLFVLTLTSSQNDFLGRKYSTLNNLTTIDLDNSFNCKTILSPSLIKYPNNPLFGQDKPWEPRIDNGYPNVVYIPNNGNKTYQLWYDDFISVDPHIEGTLYAQSNDGINWIKPNLGLVKYNDSGNNNIVWQNSGGVGIFRDIYTKNMSQLYKAFGVFPTVQGTAVSADGLHWTDYRTLDLNNRYDTHNNMFYDLGYPVAVDKYMAITRGPDYPPRTVALSKSQVNNFDSSYTEAVVVESGGDDNQTYAQITFEYYNIFLGLVMIYDSTSSDERVYCELSWSPNMYNWYRVNPGSQLIPLSPLKDKAFDSYICFTAAYPILVNNTIRLYYFGGNGPHSGDRNSSFALATIRMDGFAGITNNEFGETAIINTFKLLINGKYLLITSDIYENSPNGYIKVGLQNINGYELIDSNIISKNVTDYIISWSNGNSDFSSLMGSYVVIEFEINNAVLYTFQFSNNTGF